MLARSAKVELPRRVVVYYLLFSLVAFCWLAGSAVIVTKAIVVQRDEDELLSYLPYAATLTSIEADTGDEAKLQSLVGRFARERALRFCAFVARDNLYIALRPATGWFTASNRWGNHNSP